MLVVMMVVETASGGNDGGGGDAGCDDGDSGDGDGGHCLPSIHPPFTHLPPIVPSFLRSFLPSSPIYPSTLPSKENSPCLPSGAGG